MKFLCKHVYAANGYPAIIRSCAVSGLQSGCNENVMLTYGGVSLKYACVTQCSYDLCNNLGQLPATTTTTTTTTTTPASNNGNQPYPGQPMFNYCYNSAESTIKTKLLTMPFLAIIITYLKYII